MQKKIIALAIAAAMTAPAAAMAAPTVYGVADLSLNVVNTGDGVPSNAATAGVQNIRVSSNVSRLGLKGSEDLGGGLAAAWQMEGEVAMDVGTSSLFNRNTYIGLAGGFGTVVLGRHDTPYKMTTRKLDVFADSIADNRSLMGGKSTVTTAAHMDCTTAGVCTGVAESVTPGSAYASFDGRQSNVLAYISPTMGGVTVAAALVNLSEQNTLNTNTEIGATSLAVMYSGGPIYAALGYESHSVTPNVGSSVSETATKLGFGYTMDMFSLGVAFEQTSDDIGFGATGADKDTFGHSAYSLNGTFNVSDSGKIKAAYTAAGEINSNGVATASKGTDATQIAIGYDHKMSASTTVYALYTSLTNGDNANYGLFGPDAYNKAVGASPTALSMGVKHAF